MNRVASLTASEQFEASILARAQATSSTDRNVACVGGGTSLAAWTASRVRFSRCLLWIAYWHTLDAGQREFRCGGVSIMVEAMAATGCVVTSATGTVPMRGSTCLRIVWSRL